MNQQWKNPSSLISQPAMEESQPITPQTSNGRIQIPSPHEPAIEESQGPRQEAIIRLAADQNTNAHSKQKILKGFLPSQNRRRPSLRLARHLSHRLLLPRRLGLG